MFNIILFHIAHKTGNLHLIEEKEAAEVLVNDERYWDEFGNEFGGFDQA